MGPRSNDSKPKFEFVEFHALFLGKSAVIEN